MPWWYYLIVGIFVLVIAVAILTHYMSKMLRSQKVNYRCECGNIFRSTGGHLQTCPSCGRLVNVSGATPFSYEDLDNEKIAALLTLASDLTIQGQYAQALECLARVERLPNVKPEQRETISYMKQIIEAEMP